MALRDRKAQICYINIARLSNIVLSKEEKIPEGWGWEGGGGVILTGESKFEIYGRNTRVCVRRQTREKMIP